MAEDRFGGRFCQVEIGQLLFRLLDCVAQQFRIRGSSIEQIF